MLSYRQPKGLSVFTHQFSDIKLYFTEFRKIPVVKLLKLPDNTKVTALGQYSIHDLLDSKDLIFFFF